MTRPKKPVVSVPPDTYASLQKAGDPKQDGSHEYSHTRHDDPKMKDKKGGIPDSGKNGYGELNLKV